jgi:butyrate kinase
MPYRILAINPGSTSTKFALYEGENQILAKSLNHSIKELSKFNKIMDQFEMRKEEIEKILKENKIDLKSINAVVGRCGGLPPVKSGAYLINDEMIDRLRNNPTLEHASNLGAVISYSLANEIGVDSYIYDPVCVDECIDIARPSGLNGMDRHCLTHALNTRAMAIKYAKMHNKEYKDLNLIVAHLGGGISLNVHEKGHMIDFVSDEEGPHLVVQEDYL